MDTDIKFDPDKLLNSPYWTFDEALDIAGWKYSKINNISATDCETLKFITNVRNDLLEFLSRNRRSEVVVLDLREHRWLHLQAGLGVLMILGYLLLVIWVAKYIHIEEVSRFITGNNPYEIGVKFTLYVVVTQLSVPLLIGLFLYFRADDKKTFLRDLYTLKSDRERIFMHNIYFNIEIIEFFNQRYSLDLPINQFIFWKQPFWKRVGRVWALGFGGKVICVDEKSCKIVESIAYLLSEPRKEFHPIDLASKPNPDSEDREGLEFDPDEVGLDSDQADYESFVENIRKSKKSYKEVLALKDAATQMLADATAKGDIDSVDNYRDKLKIINRYIREAYTRKGKEKQPRGNDEKAMDAYRQAFDRFIKMLKKDHPDLAQHLWENTTTGYRVVYSPREEIVWEVGF
jgi:hypothetical protein